MNKKLTFLFSLFLMMIVCPNESIKVNAAIGTTPTVRYSATLSSNYYDSVSNKTGDDLLEGLAILTYDNHKYYTSYNDIRGGNAYSDCDPNDSSKLIDFYTGWSVPNDWDGGTTWNREHVWCQSLSGGLFGTSGAGSDIHHIRPTISGINSARGNALYTDREHCGTVSLQKYYYTGSQLSQYKDQWTGCYRSSDDYWEPRDEDKGDVARILMYLYMHYSKEVSANSSNSRAGALTITNIVYTSTRTKEAAWDMLVDWNEIDPVSTFEMNRNNYCASVTGTRNPFIDHPEYVNAIWGDGILDDSGNTDIGGGSTDTDFTYPEANSLISIKKAIEVSNQTGSTFTTDKYKIKGTIESIDSTTYGNMTVRDESGDSIYVYGVYSSDGKIRYDSLSVKPKVGETVTLLGILGLYNGAPEMKNAWLVELEHTHSMESSYDENQHFDKCSSCGATENAAAHKFNKTTTPASCSKEGYTTFTCKCGYSYVGNYVEKLAHNYGEITYSWNEDFSECTATKKCKTNSSHKITETAKAVVVEKIESTCKETGMMICTVTFTNAEFESQTCKVDLPLANHDFDGGVVTLAPTKDKEGIKTFTCSKCGHSYSEAIDKLPETSEKPSEEPSTEPSDSSSNGATIMPGDMLDKFGCNGSVSGLFTMMLLAGVLLTLKKKKY